MKRWLIPLLTASLLAACGQSGGLYLPGRQPPKQESFFNKKEQKKDGDNQSQAPAADQPAAPADSNTPAQTPAPATQPQP
jgi:predicted small lipoprotein YifL